jgi:hypothetical protein
VRAGGSFAFSTRTIRAAAKRSGKMIGIDRFLRDHITSPSELEILFELRQHPELPSTVLELAPRLGLNEILLAGALVELRAAGLVEADGADGWRYCAEAELAEAVDAVHQAFRDNRAAILRLLSTQAIERIRRAALRSLVGSRPVTDESDGG